MLVGHQVMQSPDSFGYVFGRVECTGMGYCSSVGLRVGVLWPHELRTKVRLGETSRKLKL